MKKSILIMTILAMVLLLASCNGADNGEKTPDTTKYYGSVSEIAGNQLTLNMMEEKKVEDNAPDGSINFDGGIASIIIPSTPMGDGGFSQEIVVGGGSLGSASEEFDKDFTGEKKDFTIPAGAEIVDKNGNKLNFDKIKKSSVLEIYVDQETEQVYKIVVR